MQLERVEAVCNSNPGIRARLRPARGDRSCERLTATLEAGATGNMESTLAGSRLGGNSDTFATLYSTFGAAGL
jgi:hypothetical protein